MTGREIALAVTFGCLALVLVSCGTSGSGPTTTTASVVTQPTDAAAIADSVVGRSEPEAVSVIEAAGLTVRVMSRDGEDFAMTFDFRTDRINLDVVDGIVVAATVG
jgi:hypothetical protein